MPTYAPHPALSVALSGAAFLGAATVLVGCDEGDGDVRLEPGEGEVETARADGADETLSAVDGQFSVTNTPVDQTDPNELPAPDTPGALDEDVEMDVDDMLSGFTGGNESPEVPGGDPTMGDSTLGDVTPEDPDAKEYDSAPLAPGEQDG